MALLLRHIRSAGSGPILTAVIVGLAAAPALSGEIEIRESELKFGLSLLRRRRRRQNEPKDPMRSIKRATGERPRSINANGAAAAAAEDESGDEDEGDDFAFGVSQVWWRELSKYLIQTRS